MFHAKVILSKLDRVSGQQMFTLNTNDVAQNAKGHRELEAQIRTGNRHIWQLLSLYYLPILLPVQDILILCRSNKGKPVTFIKRGTISAG